MEKTKFTLELNAAELLLIAGTLEDLKVAKQDNIDDLSEEITDINKIIKKIISKFT